VAPIASGPDYASDVERARLLEFLVREGHAESLVDAALRFAISSDAVSTVLLGTRSLEHLEYAAAAVNRGRAVARRLAAAVDALGDGRQRRPRLTAAFRWRPAAAISSEATRQTWRWSTRAFAAWPSSPCCWR
jgi:hypothetical protein